MYQLQFELFNFIGSMFDGLYDFLLFVDFFLSLLLVLFSRCPQSINPSYESIKTYRSGKIRGLLKFSLLKFLCGGGEKWSIKKSSFSP